MTAPRRSAQSGSLFSARRRSPGRASAAGGGAASSAPDAQGREMGALYDVSALLAGQRPIETLCRAFLLRVMAYAGADGGTVRTLDSRRGTLHIVVHEGIAEQLIDEEHCIKTDECLCGEAITQGVIVVRDFRQLQAAQHGGPHAGRRYRCQEHGFVSLAVFQIVAREVVIGSFSLHFGQGRDLDGAARRLLETLGRSLGGAIDNQRLIALEKELAVEQERSLMAQGLHDSIAQGLNVQNLHAQMLEDSVRRENLAEVAQVLPLRAGIEESYRDVRELLHNFRTRWPGAEVDAKLRDVLSKFEQQSGLRCTLALRGRGAPLAPEQQLQVLFILQEALSNIRKHAHAGAVDVSVDNERDFALQVRDDGCGFAPAQVPDSGQHIGLSIMRERAQRLGATLDIRSAPGAGTTIALQLTRAGRLVA